MKKVARTLSGLTLLAAAMTLAAPAAPAQAKLYGAGVYVLAVEVVTYPVGYGVVTFASNLSADASGSTCPGKNKVLVDLTQDWGRAAFSLAQAAILSGRKVNIDTNGECILNGLGERMGWIALTTNY